MSEIENRIKEFTDAFLRDQFLNKKNEYTEEALALMEKEIKKRGLSLEKTEKDDAKNTELTLADEEFVPLDCSFNDTDLLLVRAILQDGNIPFYVDTTASSDTFPLDAEASRLFSIHVPPQLLEKVRQQIEEHFEKNSNGVYQSKQLSVKERLKSFLFNEIRMSGKELVEEVEVQFSPTEIELISRYLNRLLTEAESIEKEREMVFFYLDSIPETLQVLQEKERTSFKKIYLLTILEMFQTYCDEPEFSPLMESTEALLTFFGL